MSIYTALIGWAATLLGFFRLAPQALMTLRARSVSGVSATSTVFTVVSGAWWVIYGIALADIPTSVSSIGALIAPCLCYVYLLRRGGLGILHNLLLGAGVVAGVLLVLPGVNVLGMVAAFSTVLSMLPQFVRIARTRDVSGLSEWTWALTSANTILWAVYGSLVHSVPMMLPACAIVPGAVLIAVVMERNGSNAGNDGVLFGASRRSFSSRPRVEVHA
jgi:MtN3 and saliva related transmembrane protein